MEIALGHVGSPATDWRQLTDVAYDEIARLAYELYADRGREPGHDLHDWLTAERDIQQQISRSETSTSRVQPSVQF